MRFIFTWQSKQSGSSNSRQAGFTIIEILSSLAILGIVAVVIGQVFAVSTKRQNEISRTSNILALESLLRRQIVETVRDYVRFVAAEPPTSNWCQRRKGNVFPAFDTWLSHQPEKASAYFGVPASPEIQSPLTISKLMSIAMANERNNPGAKAEFASKALGEAVASVFAFVNIRGGAPTRIGPQREDSNKIGVMYIDFKTDLTYAGFMKKGSPAVFATIEPRLYDYSNDKAVTCKDYLAAKGRGVRVVYTIVWNLGSLEQPKLDAKVGYVDVGDQF